MYYAHRMPTRDVMDGVDVEIDDEGVAEGEVPVAEVERGEEDLRVD